MADHLRDELTRLLDEYDARRITLRVVPAGTKAGLHEDQRSLAITTRHYNKTLWINSGESAGSGGLAGAKGAYALEKMTRQLVEEEVIGFVARIVG